ncbi:MAG: hypothetical protein LJE84_03995, partial [Gammaproteobacteria bacterium]|nr:hypothetical protein [Gammaproteobacteria bacterium]
MRKFAAAILLTGFLAPVAHADLENNVRRCAAIDNNLGRLECFDRLAEKLPPLPAGQAVTE